MPFDLRAQRSPICGEALDENDALRIADIQNGYFLNAVLERKIVADLAGLFFGKAR